MDKLQFHYHKSVFANLNNKLFWDPEISWKNKYKNGNSIEGERFRFSSTFLVSLTDGWHLFKLLRNVLMFFSLVVIGYHAKDITYLMFLMVISRTLYGAGFWLSYYKILNN
jgi:hypothetical protein